jgi:D-amino peptidase
MRVALSVDMEGISQLTEMRECAACSVAYWETGKPRLNADVASAAAGLLAGGASEVVVLDNHGSGNPANVDADALPAGARLETWNVFDLGEHGVEAMLQVGYHARGGVEGFISHTYVPGLRLRVGDELISESHGRIWAAGVPLLGIVGNDLHDQTLGSLAGTPFLVVQESHGRGAATPTFADPEEGAAAIRAFAEQAVRDADAAPSPTPPAGVTLTASLPNAADVVESMEARGWTRSGELEFSVELAEWSDAREPLAAAMAAGFAPYASLWATITSPEELAAGDAERLGELERVLVEWAEEPQPEWHGAG